MTAFGIAKDIIGLRQFEMEVPTGITALDFKKRIVETYPRFQEVSAFNIAIGLDYALDDDLIDANKEITIIPPVSGG